MYCLRALWNRTKFVHNPFVSGTEVITSGILQLLRSGRFTKKICHMFMLGQSSIRWLSAPMLIKSHITQLPLQWSFIKMWTSYSGGGYIKVVTMQWFYPIIYVLQDFTISVFHFLLPLFPVALRKYRCHKRHVNKIQHLALLVESDRMQNKFWCVYTHTYCSVPKAWSSA